MEALGLPEFVAQLPERPPQALRHRVGRESEPPCYLEDGKPIDPGEEDLGHQLKTWIDPAVAPNGFKLDRNAQGTPNYLSAFVCSAA